MLDAKYLTPPQIAKELGICRDTVLGWVRSGELKAVDVRNSGSFRPSYRIHPDWVAEFLNRRQVIPPPKIVRRKKLVGVQEILK